MPALPLVPRLPPIAPLNADAQQALADLKRQQRITRQLTHHLTQTAEQLTAVAEQLNDRGTIHNIEHRKKRRRAEANGEVEDAQEEADHEEFQRRVQELTRKLDNGVRSVVDDQTWVDGLPEVIKEIARKAETSAETVQRQTQRVDGESEDDSATAYPPPPAPEETPSALMKATREALATDWASKSLTERYSQHNTYVGFYRMVHDAKHPGEDGPPIPHHSLWFANEEDINPSYLPSGTQTQRTHRSNPRDTSNEEDTNNQDSSDIEIAREKVSIKCPITYLPFTDPLSSTKCPHSFDRPGIMDMLRRSETSAPLADAQTAELAQISDSRARGRKAAELRQPAIQCPVCSILLAESDFRPDPVLLRKVQRIQAAQAREMERQAASSDRGSDSDSDSSDEEEDGVVGPGKRGTQRKPVGVGSSPPPASGRKRRSAMEVKREREKSKSRAVSVVPATQLGGNDESEDGEEE